MSDEQEPKRKLPKPEIDLAHLRRTPPPVGKNRRRRLTPKLAAINVELYEKQAEAVRMAAKGANTQEIADALGFGHRSTAFRVLEYALADAQEVAALETRKYRRLRMAELNELRAKAYDMLADGGATEQVRLSAIDRLLKIQEREAKLLGLDAPVKTEHTGKNGGPIEIDWGALSPEQIVRLANGDFSVLAAAGSGPGQGPGSPFGAGGAGGENPGQDPPN